MKSPRRPTLSTRQRTYRAAFKMAAKHELPELRRRAQATFNRYCPGYLMHTLRWYR